MVKITKIQKGPISTLKAKGIKYYCLFSNSSLDRRLSSGLEYRNFLKKLLWFFGVLDSPLSIHLISWVALKKENHLRGMVFEC